MSRSIIDAVLSKLGYVQDSAAGGQYAPEIQRLAIPAAYAVSDRQRNAGREPLGRSPESNGDRRVIRNSKCAHEVLRPHFAEHMSMYESMRVLYLDPGRRVKGVMLIGQGGISGTTADHRLLFAGALKTLSTGIILAHNHPSGRLTPSAKDREWTRKVKAIGELHDVPLEDHLILTETGYLSMADEGML